jgi:hypothetical protein
MIELLEMIFHVTPDCRRRLQRACQCIQTSSVIPSSNPVQKDTNAPT